MTYCRHGNEVDVCCRCANEDLTRCENVDRFRQDWEHEQMEVDNES